jgi:hypothetical protein
MSKRAPMTLTAHAVMDVLLVIAGFAAPFVLGFSDLLWPTAYCLGSAGFGLGLNSITDYPIGIFRKLPFSLHRLVELSSPIPFIAVPWTYFADAGAMPWFMTGIGAAIFTNALLTRSARAQRQA